MIFQWADDVDLVPEVVPLRVPLVEVPDLVEDDEQEPLFVDVAALLAGGLPGPQVPSVMYRTDGHALFYRGKVNVVFGDPECGKSWIAYAAVVEVINAGHRAAIIDADHNGASDILGRLILLGANQKHLVDPDRFRLAEPEDGQHLVDVVDDLRGWRPAVAVVDSIGEVLPMLGLSSNSPDDYTSAHRVVLTALARSGAAVIAVDHMPKSEESRQRGQTGTMAKRRAVNGVLLRVTVAETFAPGHGGAASMVIYKDRPGGLREHCPVDGKTQPAGRFVMTAQPDGGITWQVTVPVIGVSGEATPSDVAELDALDPPPTTKRNVMDRCGWGSGRALKALTAWKEMRGQ